LEAGVGIEPNLMIFADPRLQPEFFQFKKLQQFALLSRDNKGLSA
jgi:hypothetical protein